MYLFAVTLMLVCSSQLLTAYQFHEELPPEERLHYFGTKDVKEVPEYYFTYPEPLQRRRRSADDRTEYMLDLFGQATHLLLEKNKDLISPGCVVQHLDANKTSRVYPCNQEIDCFYTGRSSNHSDSWVAASICGGLHGIIGTVEKTFVVQPIRREHTHRLRRDTRISGDHIVYAYRPKRTRKDASVTKKKKKAKRKKRTAKKRTIETSVVVEPGVYKFHGNETEQFVKTVMNVAALRFLDSSLKNQLYMTLNKLVILEENQPSLTLDRDSTVTLNSFCEWQATWNDKDDSKPEHADYVLLLTRLDLEHNGNSANSGLARKGMCGEKTKCSINEDIGLGSGFIITHETGHVLGMDHDGSGNNCANDKYIMSALEASGPDAFKWSQCSADTLANALSTTELDCLNDAPPASAEKSYQSNKKPGTIYTVNQQCKLMLGPAAEVCEGVHGNGQDVCGSIVCRAKPDTGVNGCVIHSTPRMDGTDCGDRKWCIGGQCVAMGPGSPGKIKGGWSAWETQYSACSRSCGGGVKVIKRYCNNPEPQYGGQNCSGSDVMAQLCNLQPCSTSQENFKEEQCAATDGEQIQSHLYHWIPNTGAIGDDSCLVSCQAAGTNWYAKRGINKDGTECISDQESTFARCVAGKCKTFGCDGHMDSGKIFDKCAVCDGSGNTCTKVSGNFNGGTAKVFTTFKVIPVGSTGITISQGNGYCFLNIKVDGTDLFSASAPRSSGTYIVNGITIKYNKNPERINIIGPTNKYIQAQVYRQYGPPYVGVDPDVYYEYHTPKSGVASSTYIWKTQAGGCSKQCGTGYQIPVITCVNSNSGTVADQYCNVFEKPKEDAQPCNTQACPPRWRTGNWGQCSKTCAGGTKQRIVECVEENNNVETVLSASQCHGIAKPSETSQCNVGTCPGVWRTGAWSACSETCARGTRTRDVKCYASSTSNTAVADSECTSAKPATTEYCVDKPCKTDISGSSCVDKVANCFQSYGEGVCNGQYKSWASDNCMKSCGVCAANPAAVDPSCQDVVSNCAQYQPGFCTNSAYIAWAKQNCKQHCGYCGSQATTTTVAPPSNTNCVDIKTNCKDYGISACTQYAPWAKANCPAFCGMCELTTQSADDSVCVDKATAPCDSYGSAICNHLNFSQVYCRRYCGLCPSGACQDKKDNCAAYGSGVCTQYKPWATDNCRAFCNLCGARRKRDVFVVAPPDPPSVVAPPLIEEPPLPTLTQIEDEIAIEKRVPVDDSIVTDYKTPLEGKIPARQKIATATKKLKLLEPDIVVEKGQLIDDSADETIESLEKDLDAVAQGPAIIDTTYNSDGIVVPEMSVCNTVLTSPSGSIDINGKLAPGVPCEQTIALPLDSRILVEFTKINLHCDLGDSLTVTDGMTNTVKDLCLSAENEAWLSTGSIAAIKFKSSSEGHGYSFTYQSLPENISVSACSQHLTSASGLVTPVNLPALGNKCEIYITGTPGKNIQLDFIDFRMPGKTDKCDTGEGVLIEDLVSGDAQQYCGYLPEFLWESRGSRVRIVYPQLEDVSGFSVKYSMQDI